MSAALLALSANLHSFPAYAVAQAGSGMAYGLLLLGGLSMINAHAPVTHRGATLSALFLVAYLAQAVVALALGKIATWSNLSLAIQIGVGTVTLLSLLTLLLDAVRNRAVLKKPRNV